MTKKMDSDGPGEVGKLSSVVAVEVDFADASRQRQEDGIGSDKNQVALDASREKQEDTCAGAGEGVHESPVDTSYVGSLFSLPVEVWC